MDRHQIYISFYEWYYTNLKLSAPSQPISAPLISFPVHTLSISDLGKELQKIKKEQKQEEEEKKAKACKLQYQQFHVLIDLRIQDLNFRLKTLIDTGSDLNLLHKQVIPMAYWEKTDLKVAGLGNVLTDISYFVPKATLCFNTYCLNLRFFLADIPIACVLGTPFLAAVSPHGTTNISPEQAGYFITLEGKKVIKLPFISVP